MKLGETELRTRAGTIADTVAIAEIYNQGIADRIATFEIEPRSAADTAKWFTQQHLVMVSETTETGRSLLRFFPLQQPGLLQRHWANSRSMSGGLIADVAPAVPRSLR